jgi:hypothetical protein
MRDPDRLTPHDESDGVRARLGLSVGDGAGVDQPGVESLPAGLGGEYH